MQQTSRVYYVDWLRIIAMFSIFLFHNNRFYNFEDWHIKNADLSLGSTIFVEVLNQWVMPLFFVLSGASVYYSLKSRSSDEFVIERLLRILVPLAILGVLVFGPFQVYLERLTHGQFHGSFIEFFPHYFQGLYGFGGNFAFHGMHLWYLLFLLLFSFIALPLLVPAKKSERSMISSLGASLRGPWLPLQLVLPLAVVNLLAPLTGAAAVSPGGWDILSYLVFFLSGYAIYSNPQAQEWLENYRFPAAACAFVLTPVWLAVAGMVRPPFEAPVPHLMVLLRTTMAWSWLVAALGLGRRFLDRDSKFLSYANETVLPFYILHQPVILAIGFFVIPWDIGIWPKLLIIVPASFLAIMAIYKFLVRPANAVRFLFGMRPKPRAAGEHAMT